MKCFIVGLVGVVVLAAVQTGAAAVVLNDSQMQTVDYQDFTFVFDPAPVADGVNAGTFVLHARGDYSFEWPDVEFAIGDIETVFVTGTAAPANADWYVEYTYDDVEWQKTFSVSAAELSSITADAKVQIDVDLSGDVNHFYSTDFVEVTLTYNETSVPEASALIIWSVLGALGITVGWWRRRTA